jgi:nitrate/nitrite transport system ATP-binding protein
VSVARALAINPQILLLDEPLSALDALTRANLQDEISRIWQSDKKTVLLITNDPDEGIYLADRIIPLTAGPGATVGPSFPVEIPRPRDRKAINHGPHFKEIRRGVISFMLNSKQERHTAVTRKLVLPDIEPENLNLPESSSRRGKVSIRKSEVRQEKVEMNV